MTTTALPKINLADVEKGLESAAKFLPMLATFVPQLAPIIAFLPLIEGGLSLLADVQAKWGDPAAVVDAIVSHMKDIATKVEAAKGHTIAVATATQGSLAEPAINFQASTGAS